MTDADLLAGRAASNRCKDPAAAISSLSAARNQLPPLERYGAYLPHDKVFLWPSRRRPLRRDLERLVAHFAGWDRPPHSLAARWRA